MQTLERTTAGHVLSGEQWLDTHAAACEVEYRDFVAAAGFADGDRVLDLGSGSGSSVPILLEATGLYGRVVCADLALENCVASARRSVTAAAATLQALPFADGCFDGVWCANTTQYLTDAELIQALREMRRVVRPGGTVAVKDVDMLAFKVAPADSFLFVHLAEACARAPGASPESAGSLRGRELRRYLERAGLGQVRQRSCFIERWAPLSNDERRLWSEWLCYLGALAQAHDLPEGDKAAWREIAAGNGLPFVTRPDFYGCEAQVLAVGTVPEVPAG